MKPNFDFEKIKYATDLPTFEKALDLYEKGKVTNFEEGIGSYHAIVLGTKPYRVSIESRGFGLANCDCYLGQNDTLCKHMVAVSIYAVMRGAKIKKEDKQVFSSPVCSGKLGELDSMDLKSIKQEITFAMRYIKPYNGPSKIWFAYQGSLSEGCSRLSEIVSQLPVSKQTAELLVKLLLRLDNKLCRGGVDDSDGAVGGFIEGLVTVLQEFNELDKECSKAFIVLKNKETCFGWEEPLLKKI